MIGTCLQLPAWSVGHSGHCRLLVQSTLELAALLNYHESGMALNLGLLAVLTLLNNIYLQNLSKDYNTFNSNPRSILLPFPISLHPLTSEWAF